MIFSLSSNKATGVYACYEKRRVPQNLRLGCVQRRVRKCSHTSKHESKTQTSPSFPSPHQNLVELSIGAHDSLAASHVALPEQALLLRAEKAPTTECVTRLGC